MQIKSLHTNIYKLYSYSRTQECLDAYRLKYQDAFIKWQKLKKEGVSDKFAQEISGISRSSYFRSQNLLKNLEKGILPPSKRPKKSRQPKWGKLELDLILKIRKENPTYGKQKIEVILKRDHACFLSQSTVGRILNHLKEKGLIQRSPSALKVKRKRNFDQRHAKPWSFKLYENMQMGERVQIDHMSVTKNGICLKHFQAWDRRSKFIWGQVYSKANSSCAKKFLQEFIKNCPFKIHSIQVDGGSEFMADFEQECARLHITLIVLPPCKPQYNGGVERANRIFKEEFYYNPSLALADSLGAFRAELKKALLKYNSYRPHSSLHGLTPFEYIHSHIFQAAA